LQLSVGILSEIWKFAVSIEKLQFSVPFIFQNDAVTSIDGICPPFRRAATVKDRVRS